MLLIRTNRTSLIGQYRCAFKICDQRVGTIKPRRTLEDNFFKCFCMKNTEKSYFYVGSRLLALCNDKSGRLSFFELFLSLRTAGREQTQACVPIRFIRGSYFIDKIADDHNAVKEADIQGNRKFIFFHSFGAFL